MLNLSQTFSLTHFCVKSIRTTRHEQTKIEFSDNFPIVYKTFSRWCKKCWPEILSGWGELGNIARKSNYKVSGSGSGTVITSYGKSMESYLLLFTLPTQDESDTSAALTVL